MIKCSYNCFMEEYKKNTPLRANADGCQQLLLLCTADGVKNYFQITKINRISIAKTGLHIA